MKKIPIESLRAGQTYTQPVYIEGNNLLVPAGIAVRKKDIERLRTWGVPAVFTDGDAVSDSGAHKGGAPRAGDGSGEGGHGEAESSKVSSRILTLPAVQENKSVYRAYTDLIDRLNSVFNQVASGVSVEARSIDAIVGRLLQAVRENRVQVIGFILGGAVTGTELAKSSVNASILATLIAIEMKMPNHRILHIATGALLHDVGMLKLPKEILNKQGGLTEAEAQRMKAHPLYAYKIVCKELLYSEDVGIVALQHHERWDGEGYPRRLAGEAIDVGARIVSVADAFEAMVSEKSYRNSMIGYQAMKNLLSDNSRRFDPDVLKAFIKTMGIYPIGSIVLLNNGSIARVTEVHGEAPLRPLIRILIDDFGKAYEQDEGETVDLLSEKSLFIARAVDPKDYTETA